MGIIFLASSNFLLKSTLSLSFSKSSISTLDFTPSICPPFCCSNEQLSSSKIDFSKDSIFASVELSSIEESLFFIKIKKSFKLLILSFLIKSLYSSL